MESESITVEVYVRAYTPTAGPRDHAIETVADLAARGVVADYEVHAWPSAVDLSLSSDVRRRYREFAAWADRTGVSLAPAFSQRVEHNAITGECRETLVTPLVCAAVRRDGELIAVLPCCRGDDDHVTVSAYLSALDGGDEPLGWVERSSATPA